MLDRPRKANRGFHVGSVLGPEFCLPELCRQGSGRNPRLPSATASLWTRRLPADGRAQDPALRRRTSCTSTCACHPRNREVNLTPFFLTRTNLPSTSQHVVQCVYDRQPTFFADADRLRHLTELNDIAQRADCHVHA